LDRKVFHSTRFANRKITLKVPPAVVRVNMTSTVNTLAPAAAAVGLGLGEAVLLDVQAVL